jgi:hypothetical protein
MGNGQPPHAPSSDAEDWADLLDDAEAVGTETGARPVAPRPLAATPMVAPEPFANDEDETATMPLDRARLGVPRPPGALGAASSVPPPIPREALTPRPRASEIPRPAPLPPARRPAALPLPALGPAGPLPPPLSPPPGLPPASTPLGGARPPPTPAAAPSRPPPPMGPQHRPRRASTAIYGASPAAPAGPPSASVPSVPPPRDDAAQQTLLGRLPVRPSVPPRGPAPSAWADDDEEMSFPSTPMPAWAHGSTSSLVADDSVVKAIASWSEPPPAPPSAPSTSDGFVSFGDADDFQFDPQHPGASIPPPSASVPLAPPPASVRPPAPVAPTPVPTGEPDSEFDFDARHSAPELDWTAPPALPSSTPTPAPTGWTLPPEEGPALALPSLPPLDDEPPPPPPPPPEAVSSPPRTRKPTPAMPMATLAALLGEAAPEEESSTRATPVVPPMPSEAPRPTPVAPRSEAPSVAEGAAWSSWEPAVSKAPAVDEKAEARAAMRDRLALEDFAGALSVAERLLQLDRDDREARQVVLRCREELRALYSRRLGPLDQIPSTVVSPSEIRWLSLDNRAGFLLSLIDGMSTIEDIIDVSTMPSLEVLRTLHNLLTQKVIVLRGARPRR